MFDVIYELSYNEQEKESITIRADICYTDRMDKNHIWLYFKFNGEVVHSISGSYFEVKDIECMKLHDVETRYDINTIIFDESNDYEYTFDDIFKEIRDVINLSKFAQNPFDKALLLFTNTWNLVWKKGK